MRRKRTANLPAGFEISTGQRHGDSHRFYVLSRLRMVTQGHLWWKSASPRLVEIMRSDSAEVLANAAWMMAGQRDAQTHMEATA